LTLKIGNTVICNNFTEKFRDWNQQRYAAAPIQDKLGFRAPSESFEIGLERCSEPRTLSEKRVLNVLRLRKRRSGEILRLEQVKQSQKE
jgi:hypothetical protein